MPRPTPRPIPRPGGGPPTASVVCWAESKFVVLKTTAEVLVARNDVAIASIMIEAWSHAKGGR
jgi:hypothetical protein